MIELTQEYIDRYYEKNSFYFRLYNKLTLFKIFIDQLRKLTKKIEKINSYNIEQYMITPQPTNSKSLLAHIFGVMQALSNGDIDCNHAIAQAKLASQACNLLNYELKRSVVQMKLREIGGATDQSCKLREIESKSFSNTMEYCDDFVDDPNNNDII